MNLYLFSYQTRTGSSVRTVTIEAESLVHAYRRYHKLRPTARTIAVFLCVPDELAAIANGLAKETPDA